MFFVVDYGITRLSAESMVAGSGLFSVENMLNGVVNAFGFGLVGVIGWWYVVMSSDATEPRGTPEDKLQPSQGHT